VRAAQSLRGPRVILRVHDRRFGLSRWFYANPGLGTVLAQSRRMTPVPPPLGLASAEGPKTDERRLRAALQRCPRALFTKGPSASQGPAVAELPSEPVVVAQLEALALAGTERVLEVGSPNAYLAALLSHLSGEVYSVTHLPELAQERARELTLLGCENVNVVHADPHLGWPAQAPYQAIVVGAGSSEVPLALLDQLDVGGRLIIPIGDANAQMLECLRKRPGALDSQTLGACQMKMLAGDQRSPSSYPWTRPREA
jgi:protein-L-isoaspartate(D-aspartate) O-methyltransferase